MAGIENRESTPKINTENSTTSAILLEGLRGGGCTRATWFELLAKEVIISLSVARLDRTLPPPIESVDVGEGKSEGDKG